MSKVNYPPWLPGFLPTTKHSVSKNTRTYRAGNRLVKPKEKRNDERKHIMRSFIDQLNSSLDKRASELTVLDGTQPFSTNLRKVIIDFFTEVIAKNDATTLHTGQAPPRTLNNASNLLGTLDNFRTRLARIGKGAAIDPAVSAVLDELAGDVAHFIRSIQITHGIVKIVDGRPRMRNSPGNLDAMSVYAKIVFDHQLQHGPDKPPKPRQIRSRMLALGHDIPERTMRDWKQQMKRGTFGHYAQNRKRQ